MNRGDVQALKLLSGAHSQALINNHGRPLDERTRHTCQVLLDRMYVHRHELIAAAEAALEREECAAERERSLRAATSFDDYRRELEQAEKDFVS